MNIVYNQDCLEGMKNYRNNFFDLAVIDPPYGIGEDGSKNHTRGRLTVAKNYKPFYGSDSMSPSKEYFDELFRISQNQIIFGANHFIENIGRNSSCWLVWDKNNGKNDFADCELAWTSFNSAVRMFKYTWNGMLQEDMKNKEYRIHPTQKPIALYKWIYKNYAKKGFKILDTHVGSGSSRIAACEFGFDYIGYEIDSFYFEEQNKRYNIYLSQSNLFGSNVEV